MACILGADTRNARMFRGQLSYPGWCGSVEHAESEQALVSRLARQRREAGEFWSAADWIFCRDGKWRPVVAEHVKMVDGVASNVGYLRSNQGSIEGTQINGHSTEADPEEELRSVRGSNGAQAVRQEAGGFQPIHGEEILRPSLHGEGDGEGCLRFSKPVENEGCKIGKDEMRSLRSDARSTSTSSRREPAQQRPIKLEDALSLMSPSRALAELYGDRRTARALRALLEAINQEGPVCDAFVAPQKAWTSIGEEAKNRLRVDFGHTAWVTESGFPLVDGAAFRAGSGGTFEGKSRAKMLKGYGNAIVPQVAESFIRAYLESGGAKNRLKCTADSGPLMEDLKRRKRWAKKGL